MAVESPVSHRLTHVALLLLTFATGLVDAVSVLELGHVFVANMTGNVIFLGFWLAPHTVVDVTAALVALVCFIAGAVTRRPTGPAPRSRGPSLARHHPLTRGRDARGAVDPRRHRRPRLPRPHEADSLIAGLAVTFGIQNSTARQFGIQELSTTVLTTTISGIGFDSRLAGGSGEREKLRYSVVFAILAGAALGATLTRFAVAPVIGLAAAVVASSAAIFWFGARE